MTRQRSSHEQKTDEDRKRYIDTTVKRVETPTVDTALLPIDSTETVRGEPEASTGSLMPTARPRAESRLGQLVREKWAEVLFAGVLIWLLTQMYTLNREVGELRGQLELRRMQQERTAQDLEKAEERLRKELERLESKVEAAKAPPAAKP